MRAAILALIAAVTNFQTFDFVENAFAQSSAKASLVSTKQAVNLTSEQLKKNETPGGLDQKERKNIATLGLESFLKDVFPNSEKGGAKFSSWLKQTTKTRFDAYVPSWSVRVEADNVAEVNLVVAVHLFKKDVENSEFRSLLPKTSNDANLANSVLTVPLAALLIDERTNDIFVLPPEAAVKVQGKVNNFSVKPGKYSKTPDPLHRELDSVETQLSDRLGSFAAAVTKRMTGLTFEYNTTWAENALQFVNDSFSLRAFSTLKQLPWPPASGLAASTLKSDEGALFVFTVRSSDKTGILEKADLIRIRSSGHTRSYWSRHLNDPTQKETVPLVLDKLSAHYVKQQRLKLPMFNETKLRLIVDRKVSERDVAKIEDALRSISLGGDFLLVPYEVNKNDIRYNTPVEFSRQERLIAKINKDIPNVYARVVPGENKFIQVVANEKK